MIVDDLFDELLRFSNKILTLGTPIVDNRIRVFESRNNLVLPMDFSVFMTKFNGINMLGTEIYSFDSTKSESIENVYDYEHFHVRVPQWHWLVPFSSDGGGNFYCLDTSMIYELDCCPIVFWMSNYYYSENDRPEVVNPSFKEWVKQVIIDWTLEDYNYDGSEKK